jgi:hypothetical protein
MLSVESRLESVLQCLFLPKLIPLDSNAYYYALPRYVHSILTASLNKQLMKRRIVHVVITSNVVYSYKYSYSCLFPEHDELLNLDIFDEVSITRPH